MTAASQAALQAQCDDPQDEAATTTDFSLINRYWNDPAFRASLDAETAAMRAKINADRDARMARIWAERGWGPR